MKILLVDDHALYRSGLKLVLNQLSTQIEWIEANCAQAALHAAKHHFDLDLILLDLILPDTSGLQTLRQLNQILPTVPTVIISSSEREEDINTAVLAGAQGYVLKTYSNQKIFNALKSILRGNIHIPSKPFQQKFTSAEPQTLKLTERQQEVLKLMVQGHSNKEIATSLAIAVNTAGIHVTAILKEFNASNRTEAAYYAARIGLI
ncbi:MAG: response regulator transcription factor [Gammaproteobacteria bacterium]|nr:response regulator transcription factor [Gammaproteobacteria bacterium]